VGDSRLMKMGMWGFFFLRFCYM